MEAVRYQESSGLRNADETTARSSVPKGIPCECFRLYAQVLLTRDRGIASRIDRSVGYPKKVDVEATPTSEGTARVHLLGGSRDAIS